jgi:hypothetical protein
MRCGNTKALDFPIVVASHPVSSKGAEKTGDPSQINDKSLDKQDKSEAELPLLRVHSVNNSILELFSGIILWADILSCASTGAEPQHSDLCRAALEGEDPKIRLENLMGCENWVMLVIRDIAALKVFKENTPDLPNHNKEVQERADAIKRRLDIGLQRKGRTYIEITAGKRIPSPLHEVDIIGTTLIFALSSLIYLEVTLHGSGPATHPRIQQLLFRWTLNFGFLPDTRLLPSVAWPVCIAGCMAMTASQQHFFREEVVGCEGVRRRGGDGTLRRALEVMERCWEGRRREGNGWDWERAMREQGELVLLI